MAKQKTNSDNSRVPNAALGYESRLWQMADALRGSMDAAEYKHVVLGLIFLKYISDAFEEQHARLEAEREQGADPEDPDEYRAVNVFWVPPEARPAFDKTRLGQLIDLVSNIRIGDEAIKKIADTYHAWRPDGEVNAKAQGHKDVTISEPGQSLPRASASLRPGVYSDVPGFCKSATLEEVRKHGHVLTPGRYVGAEALPDDGEPFEEKMKRLVAQLRAQQAEAAMLDAAIAANLKELEYG